MQDHQLQVPAAPSPTNNYGATNGRPYPTGMPADAHDAPRAVDLARLRQGVMHVRIRRFYCTLEESFDPSLRGTAFVVGTGTGRPKERGRVIDVSPAAQRMGLRPGMSLQRAYKDAPRARFLPASYDRYQLVLHQLRERYRAYSRIIETIPMSDAFIDLRGCELTFDSPVALAERLCAEIAELGLTAMIGIANGKAIAELAALLSRKDGREGVLYIPPGREASFVQTLPLAMLLDVNARATGAGLVGLLPEQVDHNNHASRPPEMESRGEQFDAGTVALMVDHLKDFGITSFAQVAVLTEEGLRRRLGQAGGWLFHLANGEDISLVVPDAPPMSQNARVRFHHAADADESCAAIRKLADYLGGRLREQHIKGRVIALMLWPSRASHPETRQLLMGNDSAEAAPAAEEAIIGQMALPHHTDDANVIAHNLLMLFAQHHHSGIHYHQVQVRIGDIVTVIPAYVPPPQRTRGRPTRKL